MHAIGGEYDDKKQATAICFNSWREAKKSDEYSDEHQKPCKQEHILEQVNMLLKSEDGRFIVGGYVNVYMISKDGKVVPDREREVVSLEALDEAIKVLMAKESRRNHMYYHTNLQIGEILEEADGGFPWYKGGEKTHWKTHVVYESDEQYPKKGLFALSAVYDDMPISSELKASMEKGEMMSFSIGGIPLEKEQRCDTDKCWSEITKLYLAEFSSCQEGVNAESKAFVMKSSKDDELLREIDTRLSEVEKTLENITTINTS